MVDLDSEAGKFNMPTQGTEKYKEMSGDYGGGDDDGGAAGKLISFFKKYKMPFIMLILLIVLAGGYLIFRPQTGTVSIETTLMDSPGSAIAGAAITISQDDGKTVADTYTDDIGTAKIGNLPANRDLSVKIVPIQPEYETFRTTINLKDKETSTVQADISKRNNLHIDQADVTYTIAPGCAQKVAVSITNLDTSDFTTDLIADPKLDKYTKSPGEKTIGAGANEIFETSIMLTPDAPTDLSGSYKLKYTKDKKVNVKIKKTDKKPKLDISFDKAEARDFHAVVADLPVVKKTQVRLKNSGSSGAIPVTELKVSVGGDFTSWVVLDTSAVDDANSRGGINPGEEVLMGLTVTVPAGTPEGPYSGQLIVSSGCDKKYIPLNARIDKS